MRENWIDADDQTIRDDIVSIAKEKTGLTNFKSTGILRGIVEIIAACVSFIYRSAVNPIYNHATLDGAIGIWLSFWGLLLGVARKQDNKTSGIFTGHAYGDGNVPEGAWIVLEGTELRYKVTKKVIFAEGDFQIPVTAENSGSNYNIGANMNIRITRVIPGLESVTVKENWIQTFGENTEEDNLYRERIRNRWRSQTLGDTKDTYRYYAESVPGVSAAKIIRTPRGPGTTDVVIASATGTQNDTLLDEVRNTLRDHELMAFNVLVRWPEQVNVNIVIRYSGGIEESAVELIAQIYVHNLGIGESFKIADLYRMYVPLDLDTIEITEPPHNVNIDEAGIIIATITVIKTEAAS